MTSVLFYICMCYGVFIVVGGTVTRPGILLLDYGKTELNSLCKGIAAAAPCNKKAFQ